MFHKVILNANLSLFYDHLKLAMSDLIQDKNYQSTLVEIKQQVVQNQYKAALAVNSRLIFTYWNIGRCILNDQKKYGWGAKIIDQLEKDLKAEFPNQKGFSSRNLRYMRAFADAWQHDFLVKKLNSQLDSEIMQPVAAQNKVLFFETFEKHPIARIAWTSHQILLDKLDSENERLFYCLKTIEGGWSRRVLMNQIEQQRHITQGALTNNFTQTLPSPQSELVRDVFKDPYFFPFLNLSDQASEKDVEDALIRYITDFLLEMGAGFAYMGRQFKLEVGGQEYFLDLLFYHTKLRRHIIIELKIDEFKPEYAGKLQFYLAALDDLVKHPQDEPSIGLILCKEANRIVAEYALRDNKKPIGVAEYKLVNQLPDQLKQQLPSAKEIEDRLNQSNS